MTLEIAANEFGQIRIFEVDPELPADVITSDHTDLQRLFGTSNLDETYVDVIRIADLTTMQLSDYILQGYDVELESHDASMVNGIEGYAILIMSSAARGLPVRLQPASEVRHITSHVPEPTLTVSEPLTSEAARGVIGDVPAKPPKSDARIGGMVATVVLILLFALVGLMIWIAA